MDRQAFALRKVEMMHAAAERWQANISEIANTAERLRAGGTRAASNSKLLGQHLARERIKRESGFLRNFGDERVIGSPDFDETPPNGVARTAGRPVARIVDLSRDKKRIGEGFATGFLVSPGLLVTNWHVFDHPDSARFCGAQFGYEKNDSGLIDPGVVFELDPDAFFLCDKSRDIAIVAVSPTPVIGSGALSNFGSVRLIPSPAKILVGQQLSIIQHPDGRHKHWVMRNNIVVKDPKEDDLFLTYSTDTLEGSSGSPGFNVDWELVAVHHCGVPRRVDGKIVTKRGEVWVKEIPDNEIDWIANEGVRISQICQFLKQSKLSNPTHQALLTKLIAELGDFPDRQPGTERASSAGELNAAPAGGLPFSSAPAMNIVVNGTANFYFGHGTASVSPPPPPPPAESPVVTEKKLKFDSDYANRPGYNSKFLAGFDVPYPTAPIGEILESSRSKPLILKYHHYSLVMHKTRRLAMWVAANVDYSNDKRWRSRDDFGTDTWKPDPRIPIEAQIEDIEFYAPARLFDRGHIMRRDDLAWGDDYQTEEYGNSDSFHWTNCTPQHERFNRDKFGYHGIWGQLENHIADEASAVGNRLIIFGGPILDPNDPKRDFGSGIKVQVPIQFWKIVIVAENVGAAASSLRAYGFILDQSEAIEEYGWEGRFSAGVFSEQQFALSEITDLSRVVFDQVLHTADPLANQPTESKRRKLLTLGDIRLR